MREDSVDGYGGIGEILVVVAGLCAINDAERKREVGGCECGIETDKFEPGIGRSWLVNDSYADMRTSDLSVCSSSSTTLSSRKDDTIYG